MTEEGGDRMDKPRSHSLSQPYTRNERKKSLFGKVKDSVKDILSPSWLSDLVSSVRRDPPKRNDNGAQEKYMSPIQMHDPPNPAPDYARTEQVPVPFNNYLGDRGNGQPRTPQFPQAISQAPALLPTAVPPISQFTSSQLPLTRLTEKSDSVIVNDDNQSQRSDNSKSTSGCSSMLPHPERKEYPSEDVQQEPTVLSNTRKNPRESDPDMATPATKRAKLQERGQSYSWATKYNPTMGKQQTPVSSNRPGFNTTLFGSPVMDSTTLLGTSFHESSFYPGKTTYGGRSSVRRKTDNLNKSLPVKLPFPVRSFVKPKKVNTTVNSVTSSTARRIMETLDKMSSPVRDAKKFPILPSIWAQNKSFSARSQNASMSGPPTHRLNVSALASISTNRQRVSFQPTASTSTAYTQDANIPAVSTSQTRLRKQETEILGGSSGKMKHGKSYHKASAAAKSAVQEEEEAVEVPDLRTEFTLPVGNLPKFTFSGSSDSNKSSPQPQAKTAVAKNSQSSAPSITSGFSFSSPIQQKPLKGAATDNKVNFEFSSPIPVEDKKKSAFNFETSSNKTSLSQPSPILSTAPRPKQKPQENGISPESGGSGFKPATELKKGSVMDFLGGGPSSFKPASSLSTGSVNSVLQGGSVKSSTSQPSTASTTASTPAAGGSFSDMFKPVSGSWKCDVCLLSNKADADKCIACQTSKPAAKPKTATKDLTSSTSAPVSNLMEKFKPAAGSWSCDVCLIPNKGEDSQCVACQTNKPAPKTTATTLGTAVSNPLKFEMPAGNWICDGCLIQNKATDNECGACSTAKPSATSSTTKPKTEPLNSGTSVSKTWSCETCVVPNKAEDSLCVCCQTPKPAAPFKYPPGEWVCETCLVRNQEGTFKCLACEYTRPGAPRDKTVPSCASVFSSNKFPAQKTTGGFNLPTKTESSSMPIKFGGSIVNSESSSSVNSGFSFGKQSESSNKENSLQAGIKFGSNGSSEKESTGTGGFSFGGSSSNSVPSTGDFKFGGSSIEAKPSSTGGFQFGSNSTETKSSSTGGVQFGSALVNTSSSEKSKTEGFSFGQKSTSSAPSVSSASSPMTQPPGKGFSINNNDSQAKVSSSEQASVSGTTTPSTTTVSSLTGGFTFGHKSAATNSSPATAVFGLSSSAADKSSTTAVSTSSSLATSSSFSTGFGGFGMPATATGKSSMSSSSFTSSTSQSAQTANQGSLIFSASKPTSIMSTGGLTTPASVGSSAAKPKDSTSTFGGFGLAQPSAGFNFGQKTAEKTEETPKPFGFGAQSSTSSTTNIGGFNFQAPQTNSSPGNKRTRDADSGEPSTKKSAASFAFGSTNNTSTPFQFSAGSGTEKSNTAAPAPGVFAFGHHNSTTSAPGQSIAAPVFNFSGQANKPASNAIPVFGSTNTGAGSAATQASSVSAFGAGQFSFSGGNKPAPALAATTPSAGFNFGAANNTGGSAFGSGFGSTTSGFGSSTPAFGSTGGTPAASLTTPVFGSTPTGSATNAFGSGGIACCFYPRMHVPSNTVECCPSPLVPPAVAVSPVVMTTLPPSNINVNVTDAHCQSVVGTKPLFQSTLSYCPPAINPFSITKESLGFDNRRNQVEDMSNDSIKTSQQQEEKSVSPSLCFSLTSSQFSRSPFISFTSSQYSEDTSMSSVSLEQSPDLSESSSTSSASSSSSRSSTSSFEYSESDHNNSDVSESLQAETSDVQQQVTEPISERCEIKGYQGETCSMDPPFSFNGKANLNKTADNDDRSCQRRSNKRSSDKLDGSQENKSASHTEDSSLTYSSSSSSSLPSSNSSSDRSASSTSLSSIPSEKSSKDSTSKSSETASLQRKLSNLTSHNHDKDVSRSDKGTVAKTPDVTDGPLKSQALNLFQVNGGITQKENCGSIQNCLFSVSRMETRNVCQPFQFGNTAFQQSNGQGSVSFGMEGNSSCSMDCPESIRRNRKISTFTKSVLSVKQFCHVSRETNTPEAGADECSRMSIEEDLQECAPFVGMNEDVVPFIQSPPPHNVWQPAPITMDPGCLTVQEQFGHQGSVFCSMKTFTSVVSKAVTQVPGASGCLSFANNTAERKSDMVFVFGGASKPTSYLAINPTASHTSSSTASAVSNATQSCFSGAGVKPGFTSNTTERMIDTVNHVKNKMDVFTFTGTKTSQQQSVCNSSAASFGNSQQQKSEGIFRFTGKTEAKPSFAVLPCSKPSLLSSCSSAKSCFSGSSSRKTDSKLKLPSCYPSSLCSSLSPSELGVPNSSIRSSQYSGVFNNNSFKFNEAPKTTEAAQQGMFPFGAKPAADITNISGSQPTAASTPNLPSGGFNFNATNQNPNLNFTIGTTPAFKGYGDLQHMKN